MKPIYYLLLMSTVLLACEESVKLDAKQTTGKIVIEGLVTNIPGRQYVKISHNTDFYQSGQTPRVTNGIVSVKDDFGNSFNFTHNPKNIADSSGYYFPATPFTGNLNRSYFLTVEVDGKIYNAADAMNHSITLDSITTNVDSVERENPEVKGRYYGLKMYGKEDQDTKDYYLFNCYRNDTLLFNPHQGAYFMDDQSFSGDIKGLVVPTYFSLNDRVELECMSLSRIAYLYYYDLSKLIGNTGGLFDSPPSNPRTNLSNGALGFFQVSAIERVRKVID